MPNWNICRIKRVKKIFPTPIVFATFDVFDDFARYAFFGNICKYLIIKQLRKCSSIMGDYLDIVLFVGFPFNRTMIRHKYAAHNEGNTPFFVYPVSEGTVDMVGTCAKGRMKVAT